MAKNAHLVLDERATIEVRIRERASFTEIGLSLIHILKIVKNEKEDFYGIRFTIRTLYCQHRNCVLE